MLVGSRGGVGPTWSNKCSLLLGCGSSGSLTTQHPKLRPRWTIVPTRIGYCSTINWAPPSQYGDNNSGLKCVQIYFFWVHSVESCDQFGEMTRCSTCGMDSYSSMFLLRSYMSADICMEMVVNVLRFTLLLHCHKISISTYYSILQLTKMDWANCWYLMASCPHALNWVK